MTVGGIRYANIGLGAGALVLIVGVLLFKDSGEGPLQFVAIVAFITTFAVYHGLDERNKRRNERDQ